MPILTTIDGVPLYTTVQEALDYASDNGLVGYHTHTHNGQIGYMGGQTHGAAATASSGFVMDEPIVIGENNNSSTISSSGGGGY
jgi:hypothetical protein